MGEAPYKSAKEGGGGMSCSQRLDALEANSNVQRNYQRLEVES